MKTEFDFISTIEVTDAVNKIAYLSFDEKSPIKATSTINSNGNIYPQYSMNVHEKKICVDKIYNEKSIEKEFINMILDNYNSSEYHEWIIEHKVQHYNHIEIKKIFHKLISCSSYIATNGRIGPAQFIYMPYKFYNLFIKYNLFTENNLGGMKVIPTNLLDDKIILGRKSIDELNVGYILFYDKERKLYSINSIGNAHRQYHVFKVYSLADERKKKLNEICRIK